MRNLAQISLCLFGFIFLALLSPSIQYPPPFPYAVAADLASREMRYHHFLFHNIRNLWNGLSSSVQAEIRSYGWEPPRPSKYANGSAIRNNNCGEDFLYMHRQMIAMVNRLQNASGAANVTGFTEIPMANDTDFPMPPVYTAPTAQLTKLVAYYKADSWYTYAKKIETNLKNPAFLRTMTLGEMGTYIEFLSDIHQGMHFRFSRYGKLMRVKTTAAVPYVDPKWDVVTDLWLADLYSSQINPWFFKLHGWIDDRINDWQAAHGIKDLKWNYTWVGGNLDGLPSSLNITPNYPTRYLRQRNLMNDTMDMSDKSDSESDAGCMDISKMNITAMEAIGSILVREGVQCEYYSDLNGGKIMTPLKCPNKRLRL